MFVRVNGMCFAHCMKRPASLSALPLMPLSESAARAKMTVSEAKPAIRRATEARVSVCTRVHACVLARTCRQMKDQTAIIKPEYHQTLSNGR